MQNNQRGDTLIEVLIAIAILSMAVVSAHAVMNYGQSIALRSVERTSTQALMNSQFSYIRHARDEFLSDEASQGGQMWQRLRTSFVQTGSSNAQVCNANPANRYPHQESRMFYIDESAARSTDVPDEYAEAMSAYPTTGAPARPVGAVTSPQPGEGLWLVARSGGTGNTEYIDFYAKACWTSLIGNQMEQATSVMRLYAQD